MVAIVNLLLKKIMMMMMMMLQSECMNCYIGDLNSKYFTSPTDLAYALLYFYLFIDLLLNDDY